MRPEAPEHSFPPTTKVATVLAALAVAAAAACGAGSESQGPRPPVAPSASGASPVATAAPASASGSASGVAPASTAAIAAVHASAFGADLERLGLDPHKLQPLSKLPPDVIRKLMPTFSKSLGVKCEFCHDKNNFKAWTPHKRVASKMWDEFVVKLALEDGGPLYCDSCHSGKSEFLERHDKKALSGWMDANYVSKLKRSDQNDHGCETCHGDPFEPRFLAIWEKAK